MRTLIYLPILLFLFSACSMQGQQTADKSPKQAMSEADLENYQKAYFASGCFWCVEAIYESVEGVAEVISGYSGGEIKNPTYQQVSAGRTRHAEAVEVYYDSSKVDYATLVKVFFGSHDPTTPNRQGPDRGPQYRSMVYYQSAAEQKIVEDYIAQLEADKVFDAPIVTEVVPFEVFYDAEDYHQDYERNNPYNPYIKQVSIPRLKRFQKAYPELLKDEASH